MPVLRKLSSGTKQLKWEDIGFAASLIAMQELRVPFMREQLESTMIGVHDPATRQMPNGEQKEDHGLCGGFE